MKRPVLYTALHVLIAYVIVALCTNALLGDVPHYQGKVILIVDNSATGSLSAKLDRLVVDLVGDGWRVLRHDVDPGPNVYDSNFTTANAPRVREVRSLIRADYLASPSEVKAVFLIGHVPVPYSGTDYGVSGGHYLGAGPSDAFYGDTISPYGFGGWTDTQSAPATPGLPQFTNAPNDGKFDQNTPPALTKLGVGRVDLYNLPTFVDPPSILISRYLDKNHDFRQAAANLSPPRRALIAQWGNPDQPDKPVDVQFAPDDQGINAVFGTSSVQRFKATTLLWFSQYTGDVQNQAYLLGYGGGNGTITSAHGIGTTGPNPVGPNLAAEGVTSMDDTSCCGTSCSCTDSVHNNFAQFSSRVVFVNLYGSFFGSWDQEDVLLRGPLANAYDPANGKYGYGLAVVWGQGFGLDLPTMKKRALGDWLGDALFIRDDSTNLNVNLGLMGDPTLRMHAVQPPSGVTAARGVGNVMLTWTPSPDTAVSGYNIYRGPTQKGPYVLVNTGGPVLGASYTTASPPVGDPPDNYYMVRALKTETIATGESYVNMSEGAMSSPSGVAVPYLAILSAPVNQIAVVHSVDGVANAAALSVDALGIDAAWNEQMAYQWYKVTPPIDTPVGANAPELLIRGLQISDSGNYYVKVTRGSASITSAAIALTATDPPHAVADTYSVVHDTSQDLDVLANDTDPDQPNSALSIVSVSGILTHPEGGAMATKTTDSRYIRFSAGRGCLSGPVTFTYIVSDGASWDQATVTVNIIPSPAIPAPALSFIADQQMAEDTVIDVPFTATDNMSVDTPDNMTYVATCSDPNLVPNVNFSFTGNGNDRVLHVRGGLHRVGTGTITVQATDPDCASATSTFQLTINPLNVPTMLASGFSGSDFQFTINGPANSSVEIKESDDLVNWVSIRTVTLNGNLYSFTDSTVGSQMHRFYSATGANGCGANMVGFIKVLVPGKDDCGGGGKALVANQLNNPSGNTIGVLLPNVPNGTKVLKFDLSSQSPQIATKVPFLGGWVGGSGPSTTLNPGEGAYIQNPTSTALTFAFIGDVPQGQQVNSGFPVTSGQSGILSSIIPRSVGLDQLGFPILSGDTIYRFNPASQASEATTFNNGAWSPGVFTPGFGEAFRIQSGASQARTWTENISACPLPPSLGGGSFAGDDFRFAITWSSGGRVNVEASADLVNWTTLSQPIVSGGSYSFVDPGAGAASHRYYRAKASNTCSANLYGFMKVSVPGKVGDAGGLALVANQLNNPAGNTIAVLLPNVPNATKVLKFDLSSQSFQIATKVPFLPGWVGGSGPSTTLNPGEGAYIQNPTSTALTFAFIGDVPQGQQVNSGFPVTSGQSGILSSIIPRSVGLDQLGFPAVSGDTLYRFDPATQQPSGTTTFNGSTWDNGILAPGVGEAFWIQSGASQCRVWTESLTPCAPSPGLGGGSFVGDDFHFSISGPSGAQIDVGASADLVTWTTLGQVMLTGGGYSFVDIGAGVAGHRFYRAKEGSACSANLYGFMKVSVPGKVGGTGGLALVANQLNNPAGNTIAVLLPNVPNATKVLKFDLSSQSFQIATKVPFLPGWVGGSGPSTTLNPGEGAYIQNPTSTALTFAFIGDVPQGQQVNSGFPVTSGQSGILSSIIPRSVGLDQLGFPAVSGDTLYRFDPATQQPSGTTTFNGSTWDNGILAPGVGEAFWIQSGASQARAWTEFLPGCSP